VEKIFAALGNVAPSHLADPALNDFRNLRASGRPDPEGDRAFDPEEFDDPAVIALRGSEGV
jgi:tRNA 2-thiocytidine biosynthesis protein TtcA